MDTLSWTDGLRATVSSCLPCFNGRSAGSDSEVDEQDRTTRRGSQTRYEELEGLLRDVNDTDGDAETMSLHSNIGDSQRRRKRKKRRRHYKSIQVFGYHLFGRPPIQLSDSEDDEADSNSRRRRRPSPLAIGQLGSAYSSSSAEAFDSDASPLDPAVISQLSPQDAAARAARAAAEREAEEQRRREEQAEKEERRRRRKERRELKRAAAAIASGGTLSLDGEEFEGFPGSGSLRPPFSPSSLSSSMASPTAPGAAALPTQQDFGPFVGGGGSIPPIFDADEPGDEDADFGGGVYTRKSNSRGSDSSRSHTHSQTSASRSNADSSQYSHLPQQYQQHLASSNIPPFSPSLGTGNLNNNTFGLQNKTSFTSGSALPLGPETTTLSDNIPRKKKKSSKRLSSNASATTSSTSKRSGSPTSQSASLPSLESPRDSSFSQKFTPAEPFIVEHDESQRFQPPPLDDIPNDSNTNEDASKFPTVGFGGVRRANSTGSGVFLARRGDD